MRPTLLVAAVLALLAAPGPADAATPLNQRELSAELQRIRRLDRRAVQVLPLAESRAGRSVERLELGAGDGAARAARPALLVVAGTEEHDLVGTAAALRFADGLAAGHAAGDPLLDEITVHVVPRLSPDAAASFFESPRRESARNEMPVDDDHDGLVDEDGPDDLDRDGRITWMRVEDPEGTHVLDPEELRLLREPERTKGERPAWRYLREGRDDDGDERWNEDGPGGVNANRNFPFGYEWFAADSGVHQVSEPEVRALADFLVAHPQVSVVVVYGSADNVAGTPKAGKRAEGPARRRGRKPVTELHPDDHAWLKRIGEEHREAVGLGKALEPVARPGSLADWVGFHRGRLGLAVAPWRPEVAAALKKDEDEAAEESGREDETEGAAERGAVDAARDAAARLRASREEATGAGDDSAPEDSSAEAASAGEKRGGRGDRGGKRDREKAPGADERAFLAWLDENHPAAFVDWKPFAHPDFPGRRVELGGFAPFARLHPPPALADELADRHAVWLRDLAAKLPRVGILRAEAKSLGRSVHEVEVVVENSGWLPTVLAHGEATNLVHPTRVEIDLPDEAVLAGARSARVGALAGSGGTETVRWIVHAPGRRSLGVTVTSALGGTAATTVPLGGVR